MTDLNLPNKIYTVEPVTGEVIAISLNQSGYEPCNCINGLNPKDSAAKANQLFNGTSATPELIDAYTLGSMFGWDLPHVQDVLNNA